LLLGNINAKGLSRSFSHMFDHCLPCLKIWFEGKSATETAKAVPLLRNDETKLVE